MFHFLHPGCSWRLTPFVMSARGVFWCQSTGESFLSWLLQHHSFCVTGGLKVAVSWHIGPPSSVSLNTHTDGRVTARASRINLPQIRYSDASLRHINSCIYVDYFGNLLLLLWNSVFPPQHLFTGNYFIEDTHTHTPSLSLFLFVLFCTRCCCSFF